MPPPNRIFRQAALDRLSSPEQLDQLMQVTTPKSWLALAACAVLVLMAVVWGIWGAIPSNVHGRGIIVKQGGVFVTTARGDGSVAEILVREGESVTNDQLLARLGLPELHLKIRQAEAAQDNLTKELHLLQNYHEKEAQVEKDDQDEQFRTYQAMLQDYQVQVKALEERLKGMAELFLARTGVTGVVNKVQLLEVSNSLFSAQHEFARTKIQIKQLSISQLQANERRRQQKLEKEAQVLQGVQTIEYLTSLYRLTSEIRSPYSGNVLEIMVKSNQLVNANSPIMSLQSAQEKLQAWLFLPPAEGKRVETGMKVALAPVSVKKEVFGLMSGTVRWVSPFPATPQLILRILENTSLVSEFSQGGAPIGVVVDLETDPNSYSGFRWSSRQGPRSKITSGTLCEGTITLTNLRPISLVLPLLKDTTGL
jgi:HlyD family secretion protein